jgi:hypothetical protein
MYRCRCLLAALLVAAGLAGCARSSSSTSASESVSSTSTAPVASASSTTRANTRNRLAPARTVTRASNGLAYSTASAEDVQPQPAPGSCHASGAGSYSEPDRRCTPGALNPAVTQATIDKTICVAGYTQTIRPPESVTEPEKQASMAAYGDRGPPSSYEYDHFVPLELGGAVNDPRNLWPEPGAPPNRKDAVENALHDLVCTGQMTLAQAQHIITTGWVAYADEHPAPQTSRAPAGPAPSGGGQCTASAAYSPRYGDYDVYVHSDQPRRTVTVTDASGRQANWHTDASGYADVYFRAPSSAAGETIIVRVGGALCHATL